jgi:hypothetical protein
MLRPRPTTRALLALSMIALLSACDDPPGSDDPGPDAPPGRNDVGPCGPLPTVFCLPGAIGRACGEGAVLMVCTDVFWQCPEGTVVPSDCGCRIPASDGGVTKKPGDACDPKPDAGGDVRDGDAADVDAGDVSDVTDVTDAADGADGGDSDDGG